MASLPPSPSTTVFGNLDVVRHILGLLIDDPHDVASASMVSPTSHVAADNALWRGVCDRNDVPCAAQEQARRALGRHIRTRCCECAEPTKYAHELLRRRLCERCERANPQAYGLVTRAQLEHERGVVSMLSAQARKELLRDIPSIKRGGYDWWLRSAVHDAAGRMVGDMWRGDASRCAPAMEGAEEAEEAEEGACDERRARSPARPRRGDSDARLAHKVRDARRDLTPRSHAVSHNLAPISLRRRRSVSKRKCARAARDCHLPARRPKPCRPRAVALEVRVVGPNGHHTAHTRRTAERVTPTRTTNVRTMSALGARSSTRGSRRGLARGWPGSPRSTSPMMIDDARRRCAMTE